MTRPRRHIAWLALLCVAIGGFYLWTVRSNGNAWKFGQEQRDYYNLLIDGWLDGHLHLKVDVPAALLQLPDPYDPKARPSGLGLHDASFYRGKYYLYFGAGPVVTLMLPFRVLTRVDLPLPLAVLIFVYVGFLASAATFLAIRRRYFPETGVLIASLGVISLGLAALGPVLLRRPDMWELPIGAGYAFAMLSLLCLWHSLHPRTHGSDGFAAAHGQSSAVMPSRQFRRTEKKRRAKWLAAAALCLALAIASRPTYLVALPMLAVPLLAWWRGDRRLPWASAFAAAAPLVLIGTLMAWHNQARFGNAFEFGQAYQFSFDREGAVRHFSVGFAPYNLRAYFWGPAKWKPYFPFIEPGELPPRPAGFGQHAYDRVFGILRNIPLAWFALAAPLALRRRPADDRRRLGTWIGSTAVLFSAVALLFACFFGFIVRYMLDFTPALMLLAGVGVLSVERLIRSWAPAPRLLLRTAWVSAAVFGSAFAVLFSLQVNGYFRERNPAGYAAVERTMNRLAARLAWLAGIRHGSWEINVVFPRGRIGQTETMLSLGEPPEVDRVFVRYLDETRVQLGFARTAMPELISAPVAIDFGLPHRIIVALGAMLPPPAHPSFDEMTADEARLASRLVRIQLDGQRVVQAFRRFAPAESPRVRVGSRSLGDVTHPRFSGQVISARRESLDPATVKTIAAQVPIGSRADMFKLTLRFPKDRVGQREPLVVSGATGEGDIVGVEYLAGDRVRFFLDHWGSPLLGSEPVAIDLSAPHVLAIRLPWLGVASAAGGERGGELRIEVDGVLAWRQRTVGHRADPEEIAFGENPIGGSHCGPNFTGTMLKPELVSSPGGGAP
ncbi:MAG: hypothetical protein Q7S40_01805 [Opitutaceae bacterium]|nr:hypothetical protein [Opitutaceae bacterium]